MAKIIEAYHPQKIEMIRRMLEKQSSKGIPMAYEIFVDNFKVVLKTTDLSEFDGYEEVMSNDSRFVRINVYNSPSDAISHTKYVFELEDRKPVSPQSLGETSDIQTKIRESIAIERERWDREQLLKELDRTKLELQEAEEYIDELSERLEKAKLKPNHLGKLDLGSLAGSALEGMIRRNPQWLNKVPGLEGLAGVIREENSGDKSISHSEEESEVRISKAYSATTLSEEEKSYLAFGKEIADHFEDEEIALLSKIIQHLSKEPDQLKTVAELLHVK